MSYSTCPSIGAAIEPDVDLKSQIHAHPRGGGEAEKVMQTETVQEHTVLYEPVFAIVTK